MVAAIRPVAASTPDLKATYHLAFLMDPVGDEPAPDADLVRVEWEVSEDNPTHLAKSHLNYPALLAAYLAQGPATNCDGNNPSPR